MDGACIIDDPPLVQHVPSLTAEDAQEFLTGYHATLESDHAHLLAQYRLVDAAMKVVGVGSVGTRCFVVVGEGWAGNDPLVLQIKEAEASVMSPHAGSSRYEHQGQRVVAGQRLMQAASDVFLGWSTGPEGRHFYVRQLRDMKGSAEIETMTLEDLTLYGGLCGATMAHAHARSVPPALLAGYCGRGEQLAAAITPFAQRYADQTEQDHEALADAVKSGASPPSSASERAALDAPNASLRELCRQLTRHEFDVAIDEVVGHARDARPQQHVLDGKAVGVRAQERGGAVDG